MNWLAKAARTILAAVAALTTLYGPGSAYEFRVGDIDVVDPWTVAAVAGTERAEVYLTLVNHSTTPDRLVGARSDVARAVRLAAPGEAAVARFGRGAPIDVAFSRPLTLRPGTAHVQLTGLRRALVRGESFTLTLVFARAGAVDVAVVVREAP